MTAISIPKLICLELRLTTLCAIEYLPHFHGPQWSAMFRFILKPLLSEQQDMAGANIWVHPVEMGTVRYDKNEAVHLGITAAVEQQKLLAEALRNMDASHCKDGHFLPGKTIALQSVHCRLCGGSWFDDCGCALSWDKVKDEVDTLCSLDSFTISLMSPLRLTRPEGHKNMGHRYCDNDFFNSSNNPLSHFVDKIREIDHPTVGGQGLHVNRAELLWLDIPYGEVIKKTLGGVTGRVYVSGKPDKETAERLVIGQYTGAGKNASFGLGFYLIPELDQVRKVKPLSRGMTLLQRAVAVNRLKSVLHRLPNSSPGPDGLTVGIFRKQTSHGLNPCLSES